jgi:cellulose synthase/poly-beta-1,6-N-acetylglucosamine synthase-like glycosyltransferase
MGIDVVVCAKNREKTMENILRQIKREIPVENLIVIYGTSSDRTKEIALQHTDIVHWDGDEGLAAARHLGIQISSTEIVAMIDTDVILPKNWYHNLIKHFNNNDAVVAVVGTCVYGYGCPPLQKFYESFNRRWDKAWSTSNILFRRDAVLKIGNFNKKIKGAGEDYDIYSRLIEGGYQYIWEEKVVVYHPMTLLEYLKHNIWWAKGSASVKEEKPFTLRQLLSRLLGIIKRGLVFATIHPVLSLYIPINDLIWTLIDIRVRSQRQKKLYFAHANSKFRNFRKQLVSKFF